MNAIERKLLHLTHYGSKLLDTLVEIGAENDPRLEKHKEDPQWQAELEHAIKTKDYDKAETMIETEAAEIEEIAKDYDLDLPAIRKQAATETEAIIALEEFVAGVNEVFAANNVTIIPADPGRQPAFFPLLPANDKKAYLN